MLQYFHLLKVKLGYTRLLQRTINNTIGSTRAQCNGNLLCTSGSQFFQYVPTSDARSVIHRSKLLTDCKENKINEKMARNVLVPFVKRTTTLFWHLPSILIQ